MSYACPSSRPHIRSPWLVIVSVVFGLYLAGCAPQAVQQHELRTTAAGDQIHVQELVSQLHQSILALQMIFTTNEQLGQLGLELDKVVVKIKSTHTDIGDGNVGIVLSGADEDEQFSANNRIELTLSVPTFAQPSTQLSDTSPALREILARYQHLPRCVSAQPKPAAATTQTAKPVTAIRDDIVAVVLAGFEAYLCGMGSASLSELSLDALTMTLAVDTLYTETEGLTLVLGPISLGGTAVQSAEHKATVQLSFRSTRS